MTKESVKLLKLKLNEINIHENIYPIYLPPEFKKFKNEVLLINENKEKYFAKISEIGPRLIENFPNILDFDLSPDALEGTVPWLYVLDKNIDVEYLGNKMIHLVNNKIKSKGENAEDFSCLPSCEDLKDALETLSYGEKLSHNEIIGRNRLIEGIISHRLANKEFIRLDLTKIMTLKRRDLVKYYMQEEDKEEVKEEWLKIENLLDKKTKENISKNWDKIDDLLPNELKSLLDMNKFEFERFIPDKLKSVIEKEWKLVENLVKEIKFYSCFENNKHICLSQPITHTPDAKKPVYSSYVVSFSLESQPLGENKDLSIFLSRRVWLKGKMLGAIQKKQKRKHSLYIYSKNKTASRYIFKYNKTNKNLEIENKVDREILKRRNIDINDIANNPTEYQSNDISKFKAVPYDAQVFSSRPRHAGIGNMEKLSLLYSISEALGLNRVDDIDLIPVKRVTKDEVISLDTNKDINIQVWELTNTFFEDLESALYELKFNALKKKHKEKMFYFIGDIKREGDLIRTTLNLEHNVVNLSFTRHCSTDFSVINRDSENELYIYNTVQDKLKKIKIDNNVHLALVELEDLSDDKKIDPKEIIKAALLDKGIPVQMITPMEIINDKDMSEKQIKSTHEANISRIAASICDLLLNIGMKRTNEYINKDISTYSFKEYKLHFPKEITNLRANEELNKNLTLNIPVISKSEKGKIAFKILDSNYTWTYNQNELYKQFDKYVAIAKENMNEHINKTTGLKNFGKILEFTIDDKAIDNNRKILICDYGSERDSFNDLYNNYINIYENVARKNGVELIFTKNNSTTPQFVTVLKKEHVYEYRDNNLKLESLVNLETTNSAGFVKCNNKLAYLIGNKPSTHTPNKADNSFEHNKIEARRRMLELVYIGEYKIEDIAKWYQLNRCLHVGYSVMTNKHMDGHILEKINELSKIIEYKYKYIFGEVEIDFDDKETKDNLSAIDKEFNNINTFVNVSDFLFERPEINEQLSLF